MTDPANEVSKPRPGSSTPVYQLCENGDFLITNYNSAKHFSSFFPGVAGKDGIPMWTFYVNRGQCICSMGIQDKEHAIMEFFPANKAYQMATTQGFRTFIKLNDSPGEYYEPFQNLYHDRHHKRSQTMRISPSRLTLEEKNESLGLTFTVDYCNVPNDEYAGLIRRLSIKNDRTSTISMSGLDGLSLIVPYGIDNASLKFTRRLTEAFVEVVNFDKYAPMFRGKVEPVDRPEVVKIRKGNFYFGFTEIDGESIPILPIVDPVKIFGSHGDFCYPERFVEEDPGSLIENQILENRLPCAMGAFETAIKTGETFTYTSFIGHTESQDELNGMLTRCADPNYVTGKFRENDEIISKLTQGHFINSSEQALDHYTRQNYLDNGLRGGFPISLGTGETPSTFYMFSRKHGDLERDYNHFSLSPTKYSQGNANFRDVNQNRRNDLFFNPHIYDENIELFYNLIQLDGFNPLVIKEVSFKPCDSVELDTVLLQYFQQDQVAKIKEFVNEPFTPGALLNWLDANGMTPPDDSEQFMGRLLSACERVSDTDHGEGFWTDHWSYNLDLLENYLAVYPEKMEQVLFKNKDFTFYDNAYCVLPRDEKYVLWDGKPMQLNAVFHDHEKETLINSRVGLKHLVRTGNGHGEIYATNLFEKILCLIVNKIASLDPEGVGVEMEADKPNWYDALNGLPGILGSSINETLEIKRNVLFLLDSLDASSGKIDSYALFEELHAFLNEVKALLANNLSSHDFWDMASCAKEKFRARTRLGIDGHTTALNIGDIRNFLELCLEKLDAGIDKAWDEKTGIISTYFINEVVEYEQIPCADNEAEYKRNGKGMICFRAKGFRQHHLPPFLEGPVHYLRTLPGKEKAARLAEKIRNSEMYDSKLNMYKVNAALKDEVMEIGRARVFSPGWFENESVWLHMEYKYMLELLRNDLYEDFYSDFKKVFVPFFDPAVYGRSILENASFIVSSANPDASIHGNGFVARLSGATAEFMNIMLLLTVGKQPFVLENNDLLFAPAPALPSWLFTTEARTQRLFRKTGWQEIIFPVNSFSTMFMGNTILTYHNPGRNDTFGNNAAVPRGITVTSPDGGRQSFDSGKLTGVVAENVRRGAYSAIDIELR